MCKSMNFVFILVIHQKLAALMVQWVATEREKSHYDKRADDDIRQ